MQTEIQIVDTPETLESRIVIGFQAFDHHLNRTLLGNNALTIRSHSGNIVATEEIMQITIRDIGNSKGVVLPKLLLDRKSVV